MTLKFVKYRDLPIHFSMTHLATIPLNCINNTAASIVVREKIQNIFTQNSTVVAKGFEWHKYEFSQSLLLQFVLWQFAYTPECYGEWSDELQFIAKSLFAMQMNWIPQKTFPLHFRPAAKGPADIVSDSLINTGVSVDENKAGDHSVRLTELE
jgi:hypothetical protein